MTIRIRKSKSGRTRYCVIVIDEMRKSYPIKTFGTRSDADRYERHLLALRDKGECSAPLAKKKVDINTYFYEWLEYRKSSLSKGWHDSITRMTKTYILPNFGKVDIDDVRPPHVGRIVAGMKEENLSAQSIVHVYNILSTAFKDAVEYFGYLDSSPVRKQDRPKIHKVERNYLTPEQSWKLLNLCKDHYVGPAIWLAILSGLRPSEVQALQWRAIDFEKGQILVCAAYKRSVGKIEPYPKQKDWALVPMPTVLAEYLQSVCKHRFPLGFAAPALKGGMLDYKKFHTWLRKLCDKAGVPRVSPHELRHSCTEIWFRSGATLEDVRRLLNHKSAETTQRYVHRTEERLSELAKAIRAPVG